MKKSIIVLLFVLFSTVSFGKTTHTYYFYVEDDYVGQTALYHTLFNDVSTSDDLFLWCCDCIMFYARYFDISYNTMNLILFVFLQPLMVIGLILIVIKQRLKLQKLRWQILAGQS